MGYELMKANHRMLMLLIFAFQSDLSAVDRVKVELSTETYYGILPFYWTYSSDYCNPAETTTYFLCLFLLMVHVLQ
jgi:hypothetical protein